MFRPLDIYAAEWASMPGRTDPLKCADTYIVSLRWSALFLILGVSALTARWLLPDDASPLRLLLQLVIFLGAGITSSGFAFRAINAHIDVNMFCWNMARLDKILIKNDIDPDGICSALWNNHRHTMDKSALTDIAGSWMETVSRILARHMSDDAFSKQCRHLSELAEELHAILAKDFRARINPPQTYLKEAQENRLDITTLPTTSAGRAEENTA